MSEVDSYCVTSWETKHTTASLWAQTAAAVVYWQTWTSRLLLLTTCCLLPPALLLWPALSSLHEKPGFPFHQCLQTKLCLCLMAVSNIDIEYCILLPSWYTHSHKCAARSFLFFATKHWRSGHVVVMNSTSRIGTSSPVYLGFSLRTFLNQWQGWIACIVLDEE